MKIRLIILLLILPVCLRAQRITAILMSEQTRMPLPHATVWAGGNTAQTNAAGIFSIVVGNVVDSVRINCAGFAYYAFKPTFKSKPDTLVIYLSPSSFALKEVSIRSTRNNKADSLRNRKDFAKTFAYKGKTLSDAMIKVNPYEDIPGTNIKSHNTTASIVGFDVLQFIGLLSKKQEPQSHLKKLLLQDEADNYVDHKFSKQKIVTLTALKGDSLETFMIRYRPAISTARKMNDYDMDTYIRKSYTEFLKVHGS